MQYCSRLLRRLLHFHRFRWWGGGRRSFAVRGRCQSRRIDITRARACAAHLAQIYGRVAGRAFSIACI